jgi:hypothetical protein
VKYIKTVSIVLLVLLFISPHLGSLISTIGQSAEANQFAGLVWVLMVMNNLPYLVASIATFLIGYSFELNQKRRASAVLYSLSIVSSTIGTILMLIVSLPAR